MKVKWLGDSTVEISSKKGKVILNPGKQKLDGYEVVVYGETSDKNTAPDGALMVDWPGEYDTAGFSFKGVEVQGKDEGHIVYVFHSTDGNVGWMGAMSEYPSDKDIEAMGEIHVLVLPVGGGDVLKAKEAFKLVEALEPNVVIPICHGDKRESLASFIKEMDVKMPEPAKDFSYKKSSLTGDQLELVILES